MKEKFIEVEVNGKRYRINRVSAMVGMWIYSQMVAGKASDAGIYDKITDHLFSRCEWLKEIDGKFIPVKIYADGRFVVPGLEDDLDMVYKLYEEALDFNFTDFLKKRAEEGRKRRELAVEA